MRPTMEREACQTQTASYRRVARSRLQEEPADSRNASGSAKFTAISLPIYPSLGPPVDVAAYYVIEGNVMFHGRD